MEADKDALFQDLIEAVKNDNLPGVNEALKAGADVNQANESGYTALHRAVQYGHTDIAVALLKVKEIEVNKASIYGDTALYTAAQCGYTDIATALLKADGIDVNKVNRNNYTALHVAALFDNTDIVTALLVLAVDEIDVDKAGNDGNTALHYAIGSSNVEIVTMLLPKFSNFMAQDENGKILQDLAKEKGNPEIIKLVNDAYNTLLRTEAKSAHSTENYPGEINAYQKIIANGEATISDYHRCSCAMYYLHEYVEAEQCLSAGLKLDPSNCKLDPNNTDSLLLLGHVQNLLGKHRQATANLTKVIKFERKAFNINFDLNDAQEILDNIPEDDDEKYYELCSALDRLATPYHYRGQARCNAGNLNGANKDLNIALSLAPNDSAILDSLELLKNKALKQLSNWISNRSLVTSKVKGGLFSGKSTRPLRNLEECIDNMNKPGESLKDGVLELEKIIENMGETKNFRATCDGAINIMKQTKDTNYDHKPCI